MSVPNSCCLEAVQDHDQSRLSDELLIRHLFSHLPDAIVGPDDPIFWAYRAVDHSIHDIDAFLFFIRCFVCLVVIQDPQPFEHVFKMYREGTLEDVQAAIQAIEDMDSVPSRVLREEMRECLGQLAIQDRRVDVVEWCLTEQGGLRFEASFQIEANKVEEDEYPELYAILDEHCFSSSAWNHHWRRN